MNLTWRDVFDSNKLINLRHFDDCKEFVRETGYKYMAFNGFIFAVFDEGMNPLESIDILEKMGD